MADEYRRFWITSSSANERERLLAEAFEAGAEGAEEVESEGLFRACVYATIDRIEEVRRVVAQAGSASTEIGTAHAPPDVDWSEAWKVGLEALSISPRLLIRPPFIEAERLPGQREIVIDPGQAFGTGGHASTRLCLEWIDVLMLEAASERSFEGVLDVGTGSGVLALAAAVLGARRAIGFDLDPVAIGAAQQAARQNGLETHVHFFTGPIEALGQPESRYRLVLANLLKHEMLPIASKMAERLTRTGRLVLAGLLDEDVSQVLERFDRDGLREVGRRTREDSVGCWVGLCLGFE